MFFPVPFWQTNMLSKHRRMCIDIGRKLLAKHTPHALDELAVPAYTKGNVLSRWLFWQRVAWCHRIGQKHRGGKCLDFGCGVGIMLPLLMDSFDEVYAVEPEAHETREFLNEWERVTGKSLSQIRLSGDLAALGIPESSLRLILAMDVFEHIDDDLPDILVQLRALLSHEGMLIVTGPTENWLYRLGRRVVGFSGDYHRRTIEDIHQELQRFFAVTVVRRLVFPFTFFLILQAKKL